MSSTWQKDGAILRVGRALEFDLGRNQDGDLLGAPGLRGRKGAFAERRSEDYRPLRKRRSSVHRRDNAGQVTTLRRGRGPVRLRGRRGGPFAGVQAGCALKLLLAHAAWHWQRADCGYVAGMRAVSCNP